MLDAVSHICSPSARQPFQTSWPHRNLEITSPPEIDGSPDAVQSAGGRVQVQAFERPRRRRRQHSSTFTAAERGMDGKDAHPLGRWGEQQWKLENGGVVVGGRRGSAVSNRSGWVRQRGAGLLPPIIGCATPDSTSHWLPHPCTSSSSVVASFFRGFQYFGDWIANNRSWKPTPLSPFRIPPWSAVRSLARATYPYGVRLSITTRPQRPTEHPPTQSQTDDEVDQEADSYTPSSTGQARHTSGRCCTAPPCDAMRCGVLAMHVVSRNVCC